MAGERDGGTLRLQQGGALESELRAASEATLAANEAMRLTLPFDDRADFDDAQRGLVATLDEPAIRTTSGRVVWDLTPYAYQSIDASCPATVNPSLWRQARSTPSTACSRWLHGIYQVRGLDLSNITLIEGDTGHHRHRPPHHDRDGGRRARPLPEHRGERPVPRVLYTHSHVDHFGGVLGVVTRPRWTPATAR